MCLTLKMNMLKVIYLQLLLGVKLIALELK